VNAGLSLKKFQDRHDGPVDTPGAPASAKRKKNKRVARQVQALSPRSPVRPENFRPDGQPGQDHRLFFGKVREGIGKGHGHPARVTRKQAVGDAGKRVLLVNQGGHTIYSRRQNYRTANITAGADGGVRPPLPDDAAGFVKTLNGPPEHNQVFRGNLTHQTGGRDAAEGKPFPGHDVAFHPSSGADVKHLSPGKLFQ